MLIALEQDYVRLWAGGGPKTGPEASILKVRGTEILQSLAELALAIEGPLGAVHDPAHLHLPTDQNPDPQQGSIDDGAPLSLQPLLVDLRRHQ